MAKLLIGTSGWSYKDWGQGFYPAGLPAVEQLPYLAKHFPTVELNASFYRLPAAKTFAGWYDKTPPGFVFSVKVSRYITHIKRFVEVDEAWIELTGRAAALREKLGVYLIQTPPSLAATDQVLARVEGFLQTARRVDADVRLAFEMRHPSNFEPPMLSLLQRYGVALVFADSSRFPHSPDGWDSADLAYFRFHGPRQLYASQYTEAELAKWAAKIRGQLADGRDVLAYFDNDVHGYALEDARRLQGMVRSSLVI